MRQLIKCLFQSKNITLFLPLNVWSLLKHVHEIVSDKRLINNNILWFAETQIKPHHSATANQLLLKHSVICFSKRFSIIFIICLYNRLFFNLAYGLHKNLELIDRKNFLGLSVLNIAKSSYFEIPLKLMISFKSNSRPLTLFSEYLHYIIEANGPDIIQDDFDIDAHQESRI